MTTINTPMTASVTAPSTIPAADRPGASGLRAATDWVELADGIGAALAHTVERHDRDGQISAEAFLRLRDSGITAMLVPTDHGGGGASHADVAAVLRALGRHDPPTALTLSMHSHVVATQVWRHRHGMDATPAFRKVVDDGAIFVSTGASDWVDSSGTSQKVDGGYLVSGRKVPTSGAEIGTIAATSFRYEVDGASPQVIHCTIPLSAEGASVDPTWDTLGMRATGSHTVVFEDVFVPDAAVSLVRPAGVWPPLLDAIVGAAMPLIMSVYVGLADAVVEEVRKLTAGREAPHVVHLVGEMMTAHTTAADMVDAMITEAADLTFDGGDERSSRILARKSVASDAVIACARLGIEATGGAGFMRSSPLERLYRDAHGSLFHPLPRAKQIQFSGRVGLGLAPYG
jgi:alkylation response protein AidB-like acyl-CoA dehydrogenase